MSIRPCPILLDMPLHIKKNIVDHLDLETRFQLRNCSKEFRDVVDNAPIIYYNFSFKYRSRTPRGADNGYEFSVSTSSSCLHRDFRGLPGNQSSDLFQNHFSRFLKNPRAKFELLYIDSDNFSEMHNQLNTVLSSLPQQINVTSVSLEKCDLPNADCLMSVLPFIKPGYLEHINLGYIERDTDLNGITDLEQFKQAKSAEIAGRFIETPLPKLFHFKRLYCFSMPLLTVENIQEIIDNALRHGESFERWALQTRNPDDLMRRQRLPREERYINVPNSHHQLKLAHEGNLFYLTNEDNCLDTDVDTFDN